MFNALKNRIFSVTKPRFNSFSNNLKFIRFLQLSSVFGVGLAAFLFSDIAHSWWIFVTVIVISAAIEPGLLIKKSINRSKGTLLAFLIFLPLIYLLQFNYRMIPLALIVVSCAMWLPSGKRYDLSVIFITLQVFLITAYTYTKPLIEGPFEMVVNRGVCTVIGILICLTGDYVIFSRFNYSRKVYFLLQREVCTMLVAKKNTILTAKTKGLNNFLLVDNLRMNLNEKYASISGSGASLLNDIRTSPDCKDKIYAFEDLLFKLRKEIFAIYYCSCVLDSQESARAHLLNFDNYLHQANANFISLR